MKRAQPLETLRAAFAQAHVFANDADNVRLLLYGLGEAVGHQNIETRRCRNECIAEWLTAPRRGFRRECSSPSLPQIDLIPNVSRVAGTEPVRILVEQGPIRISVPNAAP